MTGLVRLASLLERWKPVRNASAETDGASAVAAVWADAVGPDIARRTRPGRTRGDVLTVYTAGSTWSHQLTFLAPTIVAALADRCPKAGVRGLRFVVASGGTKALLDGLTSSAAARRTHARGGSSGELDESPARDADDIASVVERLRRRQQSLDRRRVRDGWTRCAGCLSWRRPASSEEPRAACAVCSEADRRAVDGRVERLIADAPWLRRTDLIANLPRAEHAAYERVRRRLLTRWEGELFAARRRLRRGELTAADRVTAWSYVMLRSSLQQREIGRAVVADVLDAQWAQALLGPAAARAREASATVSQKQRNTTARVFTRRDHT